MSRKYRSRFSDCAEKERKHKILDLTTWLEESSAHKQRDVISEFGESACGEPFRPQHILIDFTPDEIIDNEFVQKKCCAFWSFIKSHPELDHLMVEPEAELSEQLQKMQKGTHTPQEAPIEKSAVSVLSSLNSNDMSKAAFQSKMCRTFCEDRSEEYDLDALKPAVPTTSSGSSSTHRRDMASKRQKKEAIALNQKLVQWDQSHPSSIKPPKLPSTLIHAVLQRKP